MKQLASPFIVSLFTLGVIYLNDKGYSPLAGAEGTALLYGVGFIIFFIGVWLFTAGWRNIPWVRRLNFHGAHFEGVWLQRVDNERPFSLAWIGYDPRVQGWIYRGYGYDISLTRRAEWHTRSIHYETDTRKWIFFGAGKLFENPSKPDMETSTFDIAVVVILPVDTQMKRVRATAADFSFSNTSVPLADRIFTLELVAPTVRLSSKDVTEGHSAETLREWMKPVQFAAPRTAPKQNAAQP